MQETQKQESFFARHKFEILVGSALLLIRFGSTAYRAYKMRVRSNTILELDLDSLLREKVSTNTSIFSNNN